jgi:predicted ATPase
MLTSLRIQNYRSCTDVVIRDIGSSLLLVGPNNAGKTTIMNAISWVRDVATVGGIVDADTFYSKSAVELYFNIGSEHHRYRINAATENPDSPLDRPYYEETLTAFSGDREHNLYVRRGEELVSHFGGNEQIFSINRTASTLAFLKSISPESMSKLHEIEDFMRRIRYFPLDSVADDEGNWAVVTDSELNMWKAGAKPQSSAGLCMIKLVDLWRNKRGVFDELTALLGNSHLNLVNQIEIQERTETVPTKIKTENASSKQYLVFFRTQAGYAYYHDLSFGTKRILHALIAILYETSSVILLEQPEDGIHPGLLTRFTNLLLSYTDPMQLILASHSSAVINIIGAENIRIVQAPKGETEVHGFSDDELVRARQYVSTTGQLADFVRILED